MVKLLSDPVGPHARHLLAGSGYILGRFECPREDARWQEPDWIGPQPHIVIPHTAVRIRADGAEEAVVTPADVLIYDGDVHYRRRPVDVRGDRSLFVILDEPVPRPRKRPLVRRVPGPADAFATITRAALAPAGDLPALDEWILTAIGAILGTPVPPGGRQAVEQVKALLADDPVRRWTLAELGSAVHYSPFALARMFRAATGQSIAVYRRHMRLRQSYPRAIRPGADLARIAVEHGFANHSHYTREFRAMFGHPPSHGRTWPGASHVPSAT